MCPRIGHGDGGGWASAVRILAAPDLLARGPPMDPVHVAALAVEPQWCLGDEATPNDPSGSGRSRETATKWPHGSVPICPT